MNRGYGPNGPPDPVSPLASRLASSCSVLFVLRYSLTVSSAYALAKGECDYVFGSRCRQFLEWSVDCRRWIGKESVWVIVAHPHTLRLLT